MEGIKFYRVRFWSDFRSLLRKITCTDTDITTWEWCDGIGFLIIITGIVYVGLFYSYFIKPFLGPKLEKAFKKPLSKSSYII